MQLTMFDDIPTVTERTPAERAASFHDAHPQILDVLLARCRKLIDQGRNHYGTKALFEWLRWQSGLWMGGEPFKMNNDFTPWYARELNWRLGRKFFRLREVK